MSAVVRFKLPLKDVVPGATKANVPAENAKLAMVLEAEFTVTVVKGVAPTIPEKRILPLPAFKVNDCPPSKAASKVISPPVEPVVVIVVSPPARRTGLLNTISEPVPDMPVPTPAPPMALMLLLFRVTVFPLEELTVTDPAFPPFREAPARASPPEVLISSREIEPAVVPISTFPPTPPIHPAKPPLASPPDVSISANELIEPVSEVIVTSPPAPPFSFVPTIVLLAPMVVRVEVASRLMVPNPTALIVISPESIPVPEVAVVKMGAPVNVTPTPPPSNITSCPTVVTPALTVKVSP